MPANLTPPYHDAEERFKAATTHEERLEAMREMIALLPKHKGTEKLYADLKKRLAKLEDEVEHAAHGGRRADPGHVKREGRASGSSSASRTRESPRSSRLSRTHTPRWGNTRSRPASRSPG